MNEVHIEINNGVMNVSGIRRLDENYGERLRKEIVRSGSSAPMIVEIDLSEAIAVDAAGLGKLVLLRDTIAQREHGGQLHLVDPAPIVRQMLRLTRLEHSLSIIERERAKKAVLALFVFIDACGWEIIRNDAFARDVAPHRHRLRSVFGFSSACIPSILSGRWPCDHRNWCYFVRDPEHSPFRFLRPLRWLPKFITSRRIFRRWLSRFLRGPLKFRGYFDLYNIPFRHISLFDFTEKKNPLQAGGLNAGPNIFDFLEEHGIPYHVSDPKRSELENLYAIQNDIIGGNIDFGFLYWPALDGLMHNTGNVSPRIGEKLRQYEQWLRQLMATAQRHYEETRLYVFSDHGMANCDTLLDLRSRIDALPLRMPHDFTVVYDSTMARFWFESEQARDMIVSCLRGVQEGRIIEDAELERLGALFPDRYFGELIFLANEGVLIVPSDMGERPLRGMHGYHPDDAHSFAALMTNVPGVSREITDIPHIYNLMANDAQFAHFANNPDTPSERTAVGAELAGSHR